MLQELRWLHFTLHEAVKILKVNSDLALLNAEVRIISRGTNEYKCHSRRQGRKSRKF